MNLSIFYVFKYKAQKLCESFMCIFFRVFWSEMLCECTLPCTADSCDTCMNPDVVFTVFKIVFLIPRINLIKIWNSQVSISVIFITFLSG